MPTERIWQMKRRRRSSSEDASSLDPSSSLDGLLFCVQRPGDALYVPPQWAHATTNLGGVNVGVAVEFMSAHEPGPGFFSKQS